VRNPMTTTRTTHASARVVAADVELVAALSTERRYHHLISPTHAAASREAARVGLPFLALASAHFVGLRRAKCHCNATAANHDGPGVAVVTLQVSRNDAASLIHRRS